MKKRRILLKLSGESLCSPGGAGIDTGRVLDLARRIQGAYQPDELELALILGGGNFIRGGDLANETIERASADHIGMLATVMNSIALRATFDSIDVPCRVLSAIHVEGLAEPFVLARARSHLADGQIVIFAGGTGNPYFTTDTTAALRALQIGADFAAKATKVDGVYSDDPDSHPDAVRYDEISYADVLRKRLRVMDSTAISMCMDHGLPIRVFSMDLPGQLERLLAGETIGTLIGP